MSQMVSMWRSGVENDAQTIAIAGCARNQGSGGAELQHHFVTLKFLATNVSFLFRRLLSVFLQLLQDADKVLINRNIRFTIVKIGEDPFSVH
jgi:hypothetical protein